MATALAVLNWLADPSGGLLLTLLVVWAICAACLFDLALGRKMGSSVVFLLLAIVTLATFGQVGLHKKANPPK